MTTASDVTDHGGPIVGVAGWSLSSALADHFPASGTHLQRYGAVLSGVEINSSFYRPHRRTTYERWAAGVPGAFRFAVEVPKAITHERRLSDCDDLIDRFAGEIEGLGFRLGPLLVQLPPSAAFHASIVDRFFTALRERIAAPVVCEPRHAGWFTPEAEALMTHHRVARVAADPAPLPGADEPGGWDGLLYFRLHGSPRIYWSNYGADALTAMARRLVAASAGGIPAWCIFDNTAGGCALGNALSVARDAGSPLTAGSIDAKGSDQHGGPQPPSLWKV